MNISAVNNSSTHSNQGNRVKFNHKAITKQSKFEINDIFYSFAPATDIPFKGYYLSPPAVEPKTLRPTPLDIPSRPITGREAILIFNKLKSGQYLSAGAAKKSPAQMQTKLNNLTFLDNLDSERSKKMFIAYYKDITGFPDTKEVSRRIEKQFMTAVFKASEELKEIEEDNPQYYDVLYSGYDGICSVGSGYAFPGSDLDKSYVILQGTGNPVKDAKIVQNYKDHLWANMDQRLLSYNHDGGSFTAVYTKSQFDLLFNLMEEAAVKLYSDSPHEYTRLQDLRNEYSTDYIASNEFFVNVCNEFPLANTWERDYKNVSRETIYSFAYVVEALIYGKQLFNSPGPEYTNSITSDLINISQINGIKALTELKEKYVARKSIKNDFEQWPVDVQLDFIKSMINASCGEHPDARFYEYYKSKEEGRFKNLMHAVDIYH